MLASFSSPSPSLSRSLPPVSATSPLDTHRTARAAHHALRSTDERARTSMLVCSTCKRTVADENRQPFRKTCLKCLKKSAARAQRRRARQHFDKSSHLTTYSRLGMKVCSSCKCGKRADNFVGTNKSCETCLLRRRRAKTPQVSVESIELCFDDVRSHLKNSQNESVNCISMASEYVLIDTMIGWLD